MSIPKPFIAAAVAILTALMAALAFESVYRVTMRPRSTDPPAAISAATTTGATATSGSALALRLVDTGGVGIPFTREWGKDYSHDRRIFREAILEQPPYIDTAAFQRIEQDWRAYVDRMREYGNNAVAVPLLLELIDFDRVPSSRSIYEPDSPFRARHAVLRRHFASLFEYANQRGMQVFLDTDMLTVTAPLLQHLRRIAPKATPVGVDTADPAVWAVYRAGLEELFDAMPSTSGLVVRFGEGGNLYNTAGWPYRSEMAVRNADSLRAMLRGLLPAFEARHKTLVLRSWTVGVGSLGRLHIDPAMYERVLGDIDSPALVVSTKMTAGDFFSYLPLNRTLMQGRHRRIVELQAKPEFEGFSAFPNFLGDEYARALRVFRAANPHVIGTYLFTQAGGPLRAGPRTLYPLHGFWLWTDANVFTASRLAVDPDADVHQLARQWAAARFGDDARVVDAVTSVLHETRDAVLKGFYIRPFATRDVRINGFELPPLMWIFEWDMVGGWHSLLSLVYQGSRDAVGPAIQEGYAAAATVRQQREQLNAAFVAAKPAACAAAAQTSQESVQPASSTSSICAQALRSLDYQETLFDALATWRETFLSYYRWLDTGDDDAWTHWRDGRQRFDAAAARHVAEFGNDLQWPAFALTSATEATTEAGRSGIVRRIAAGALIGVIALLILGSQLTRRTAAGAANGIAAIGRLAWTAAATPWRLDREPADIAASSAVTVTLIVLTLIAVIVTSLTGFTTAWIAAGSPLIVGLIAIAFESSATGVAPSRQRGRLLVTSVGPLMPGLIALLALIAYAGPLGFWYRFWTSPVFRAAVVTIVLSTMLWTMYVMQAARTSDGWSGRAAGLLAAAGAGLATLTALLPDWLDVLRFLDHPLNFAPATGTMLFALQTYAGVRLDIARWSWTISILLLVASYVLRRRSASRSC